MDALSTAVFPALVGVRQWRITLFTCIYNWSNSRESFAMGEFLSMSASITHFNKYKHKRYFRLFCLWKRRTHSLPRRNVYTQETISELIFVFLSYRKRNKTATELLCACVSECFSIASWITFFSRGWKVADNNSLPSFVCGWPHRISNHRLSLSVFFFHLLVR